MGRISVAIRRARVRRRSRRGLAEPHAGTKRLIKLAIVIVVIALAAAWFKKRLTPVVEKLATSRVVYLAGEVINDAINDQITLQGVEYEDFVHLETDANGRVTALKTDMAAINRFKSDVTALVLDRINNMDNSELYIPLGNIIDGELFSGRGPKIPIIVVPVGSAWADFSTNVSTAGINQTRHQIIVTVSAEITMLLPGYETTTTVSSQVVAAETVIVGDVPQNYTYLEDTGLDMHEIYGAYLH